MISYILGKGGEGKTTFCLSHFDIHPEAVFFCSIPDDRDIQFYSGRLTLPITSRLQKKCIVDFIPAYRKHLDRRDVFEHMMFEKVREAVEDKIPHIILDEFQLYAGRELVDLIGKTQHLSFFLCHQFPEQIDTDLFSSLWDRTDKKYLFNPLPSSHYHL